MYSEENYKSYDFMVLSGCFNYTCIYVNTGHHGSEQ